MFLRVLPLLAIGILISGCVSSKPDSQVSEKDAARFNTQLGVSYFQRGDLEGARDKLERAVQQDPTFAPAHASLGLLYERVGDNRRAGEHLRRAARLEPDDPNILNSLGGFLCRQGDRREGIRYFETAAGNAFYRTPEIALTNAGVCARGIPDDELAENFLRAALDRNRNSAEALVQLADLSLDTGRPLQARAFLQRYEAVAPMTPYTLELAMNIERAAGDHRASEAYAERLRREFPDSREARELLR